MKFNRLSYFWRNPLNTLHITSSNTGRSKFFHHHILNKICNNGDRAKNGATANLWSGGDRVTELC